VTSPGSLLQCLAILMVNNFLPTSGQNSPCRNMCPATSRPSTGHLREESGSTFSAPSQQVTIASSKFSPKRLFSRPQPLLDHSMLQPLPRSVLLCRTHSRFSVFVMYRGSQGAPLTRVQAAAHQELFQASPGLFWRAAPCPMLALRALPHGVTPSPRVTVGPSVGPTGWGQPWSPGWSTAGCLRMS